MDGSFMHDGAGQAFGSKVGGGSNAGPLTVAVISTGGDDGLTVELLRHGFSVVPAASVPTDPAWLVERCVDAVVGGAGCDAAAIVSLFERLGARGSSIRFIGVGSGLAFDAPWAESTPSSVGPRELVHVVAAAAAASRRAKHSGDSLDSFAVEVPGEGLAETMADAALASACALADRLSGELDVEMLLRRTLEYVAGELGVVNAAVYLPRPSGDLALGAYVGATLPGDEAEMIFDDLASSIHDRGGPRETSALYASDTELDVVFGGGSYWLERSDVIVTPCVDNGRELAVLIAFRPRTDGGLDDVAVDLLESSTAALTGQLARAVRVHNRLCGEEAWFGFDVEEPGNNF